MPEHSDPVSARACPSCARLVPSRVDQCRCGHHFTAASPRTAVIYEPDDPSSNWQWLGATLVILSITLAVLMYVLHPWSREGPEIVAPQLPPVQQAAAGAPPAVAAIPVQGPPALAVPASLFPSAVAPPPAPASFEEIVGSAMAAVVLIDTGTSRGSGFFVTPDLIVTNAHVVESHTVVTVKMSDGATVQGRVLRSAPEVDIAIVRPDTARPGQGTLPLGAVGGVRPGQEVIAIGSALGVLQNTVTRGIVSGIRNAGGITLIQTDAAINHGNSGGPLIDHTGRVIGITTLKVASDSESLGFAVAIDHARALIEGRPAEHIQAPPGAAPNATLAGAFGIPAAPSPGDAAREQAALLFERAMQGLAQRADELDDYWQRFHASCGVDALPDSGDRPWFGIWNKPAALDPRAVSCLGTYNNVAVIARGFLTAMGSANEAARGAGVYPGVKRDLRRKYRLDWNGWE
ncbi:MAG: trypsin-like peptidase domain-containing protein [Acidobacteriota bacterium]